MRVSTNQALLKRYSRKKKLRLFFFLVGANGSLFDYIILSRDLAGGTSSIVSFAKNSPLRQKGCHWTWAGAWQTESHSQVRLFWRASATGWGGRVNHASKLCKSGTSGTIVFDIPAAVRRRGALDGTSGSIIVSTLWSSLWVHWNTYLSLCTQIGTGLWQVRKLRPHGASTDLSGDLCITAELEEVAHSLPTCSDCELCDQEKSEAVPFPFLVLSRLGQTSKSKETKYSPPSPPPGEGVDTSSWKSTAPTIPVSPISRALQKWLQQSWCGCPRQIPYATSRQSMRPLQPVDRIDHQIRIFYFNFMFFLNNNS